MPITLRNRSQTEPRTYILDTEDPVASHALRTTQVVQVEVFDPQTGARALKSSRRRFPRSITLQPRGIEGDSLADLPDQALHCPRLKRAVAKGEIEVFVQKALAPPPTAPPAAALEPDLASQAPEETDQ